ncbi:MAG: phosphatidate cytidylyltransferase [Gammaproteobacteria bacterium]
MIGQRIMTAVCAVVFLVLLILYGNALAFTIVAALFALLAAREWARLTALDTATQCGLYLLALCLLMLVSFRVPTLGAALVYAGILWWCAAVLGIVYVEHWRRLLERPPIKLVTGLLILSSAWFSLISLRVDYSRDLLLFLLCLIWTADSSAYFCGKRWGRTRLAAQISPGKTWEGVYGALLAGLVWTLLYSYWLHLPGTLPPSFLLLLAALTIGISIVGDLTISVVKRNAGVKDSGNLFPGHGGALDRLDSLLAAAPLFLGGLWLQECWT